MPVSSHAKREPLVSLVVLRMLRNPGKRCAREQTRRSDHVGFNEFPVGECQLTRVEKLLFDVVLMMRHVRVMGVLTPISAKRLFEHTSCVQSNNAVANFAGYRLFSHFC